MLHPRAGGGKDSAANAGLQGGRVAQQVSHSHLHYCPIPPTDFFSLERGREGAENKNKIASVAKQTQLAQEVLLSHTHAHWHIGDFQS